MSDFSAKLPLAGDSSPEVFEAVVRDPSAAKDDLTQLIAACQGGEREAQRELFERFQGRVLRLASRMVGTDDAADLLHQIFLHVFQTIGQFAGRSRIETWIYRVSVNECLQHIRRGKSNRHQSLKHDPVDRRPAETKQFDQRELMDAALVRLEPDLRAIFLLREVEGQNYVELAESLKLSEGTVASRLHRARKQLKRHLIDLGWEP